ncbi:hypothetical protein KR018_006814, partial [Drosophila ironensis]
TMKYAIALLLIGLHHVSMAAQCIGPGAFLQQPCGIVPPSYRITGGTNSRIDSTPWMAMITRRGLLICGGSLVTNRRFIENPHPRSKVRLGDVDSRSKLDSGDSGALEIDVDAKFVHQDFTMERHDLALLRLSQPVNYTNHISPMCLLLDPAHRNLGEYVTKFKVFGWGKTETGQTSRVLQETYLYNLPRTACQRQLGLPVDGDHICAERSSTSTCNGDSGGPLIAKVIYKGRVVWIQFGIVSYGHHECRDATVFTNVMTHVQWIRNIV